MRAAVISTHIAPIATAADNSRAQIDKRSGDFSRTKIRGMDDVAISWDMGCDIVRVLGLGPSLQKF